MDKEKISKTFAELLNDEDRNFDEDPITYQETAALIEKLYRLASNPKIPEELAQFYMVCLNVVKEHIIYN